MRAIILFRMLFAVICGSTSAAAQSVFTVDRLTDTGEGEGLVGDLRYCITNATSGEDVIVFTVTGTINLTRGSLPGLDDSVSIQGPGANLLTVRCYLGFRNIFTVGSTATVQISAVTMANCGGRAIYNRGTLTISSSALSANGVIDNYGGAIYNEGILTISDSTLSGNGAAGKNRIAAGGAIYNYGTLTISNSTLSANTVIDYGSGGAIGNEGTLTISNSTLFGNHANDYGGGIVHFSGGMLNLRNTILAGNTAPFGPDLGGSLTTSGYNLIGNTSGGSGYDETDLLDVDPLLGPLQDNGGPTFTHSLLPGSPAIDAGDPDFIGPPDFDQRGDGFPRIVNGIVDIGAFEVQADSPGGRGP
jgi:hypothetical protein